MWQPEDNMHLPTAFVLTAVLKGLDMGLLIRCCIIGKFDRA